MSQLSEEVKTKVMAFAVENKLETPDRMAFLNHTTDEMANFILENKDQINGKLSEFLTEIGKYSEKNQDKKNAVFVNFKNSISQKIKPAVTSTISQEKTSLIEQPAYSGNPHTKKMVLQSILNELGFRGKKFADVISEIKSRYDGLMLEFKGIQFVLFHVDDTELQQTISSAGVMEGFKPLFEPGKFITAEIGETEEKPKVTRQTQLLIDLFGLRFWNTAFPSLAKISEDKVAGQFKQKVITETKKSITNTSFDVSEEELTEVDNAYDAAMYEFCIAILQKL